MLPMENARCGGCRLDCAPPPAPPPSERWDAMRWGTLAGCGDAEGCEARWAPHAEPAPGGAFSESEAGADEAAAVEEPPAVAVDEAAPPEMPVVAWLESDPGEDWESGE
mmetsp:Transcript_40331/g.81350  ORF Transcript_40331/g.81350 Transcript_40331/m.81350 type:complete len:109 (-) Transcript_40331:711-1037(-)